MATSTMEPQNLTITGEDGVQIFGMTDEHTRLEIEKFPIMTACRTVICRIPTEQACP